MSPEKEKGPRERGPNPVAGSDAGQSGNGDRTRSYRGLAIQPSSVSRERADRVDLARLNMPLTPYEGAESDVTPRWIMRHRRKWLRWSA